MLIKEYLILCLLLVLPSCKNLTDVEDLNINISGVVINESTGKPLKDISVSLLIYSGGYSTGGGSHYAASTKTNDDGKYQISYTGQGDNGVYICINENPYNEKYLNSQFPVYTGESYLESKIYQNTSLRVRLNSKTQPKPGTYTLWIPGGGTNDTVAVTDRAKGNFYNSVRLYYTIENKNYAIIDSVFCPIDTVTNFNLNF